VNLFVAEAVTFGIEGFREPLVRVLIGAVGAGVFGDALHNHRADLLGDHAGFEVTCDGRANELGVGGAEGCQGQGVVLIGGEANEGVAVCHCCALPRRLRNPFLQSGHRAKSLGVYFPGDAGPEDGDTVGEAVETHAVFGVSGGLLQPENGSVVGFFHVNESIAPCKVLECFEFFHSNFSLRSIEHGAG